MHFIVDDHARFLEIDRIDGLVVAIGFIAIEILGLAAMATEMEQEVVVWLGTLDQPMHCTYNICAGRLRFRRR